MCHVSHVTCHVLCVKIYIFFNGASQWRVSYQRGLPNLVKGPIEKWWSIGIMDGIHKLPTAEALETHQQ